MNRNRVNRQDKVMDCNNCGLKKSGNCQLSNCMSFTDDLSDLD